MRKAGDRAQSLQAALERQSDLCAALEALADTLPTGLDPSALRLAQAACRTLRHCHRMEEDRVFAAFWDNPAIAPILERLRAEHIEDEDHARDLEVALDGFIGGTNGATAEEIGYILRGLFTSLRRHAAFERDHLLPLFLSARNS
jgi:hypothetical protein